MTTEKSIEFKIKPEAEYKLTVTAYLTSLNNDLTLRGAFWTLDLQSEEFTDKLEKFPYGKGSTMLEKQFKFIQIVAGRSDYSKDDTINYEISLNDIKHQLAFDFSKDIQMLETSVKLIFKP